MIKRPILAGSCLAKLLFLNANQLIQNGRPLKQRSLSTPKRIQVKLWMLLCLVSAQSVAQVYVSSGAGLSVVDPVQNKITAQLPLGFSLVALSRDGRLLYGSDGPGLTVVDTISNAVITTIPVGIRPNEAVLSPDGNRIYVATPDSFSVTVVDTQNNLIIKTVSLGANPNRLAMRPDGSQVYVGTGSSGIKIIDTTTNTVVGQVAGNGSGIENAQILGLSFGSDGRYVYAGTFGPGFFIVDTHSNAVVNTVLIPGATGAIISVLPSLDGTRLYVANDRTSFTDGAKAVFVLDAATNSVLTAIPVGEPSAQMALSADGRQLYVGDVDTGNLDIIDTGTNQIIETINVTGSINGVVITGVATQRFGGWPMSGHDPQRTGFTPFVGPKKMPFPSWVFPTSAPVVGDIAISAEGKIYFASDKLYALNPDGTPYAPAVPILPLTSPAIDDINGYIYITAQSAPGRYDVLRYSKQLENSTVVFSGAFQFGAIASAIIVGPDGTIYFSDGVSIIARGPRTWISPGQPFFGPCFGNPGLLTPTLGRDGSVYSMCQSGGGAGFGSGIYRFDGTTGAQIGFAGYSRGGTELIVDFQNNIRAGYQAFNGITFNGSYDTWDADLNQLTTTSLFNSTTSRSALMPDGTSTVRIGFSFQTNELDAIGAHVWGVPSGTQTLPNFSTVPTVDALGNVFVGTVTGVAALDGVDGSTLWFHSLVDAVTTQPVISASGALFIGSSSGHIYAFESTPTTGTIIVSTNNTSASFIITGPASFTGTGTALSFNNVPPGQYTITYGPINQHVSPPTATATLDAGGSITFNGLYTPTTLAVCVAEITASCSHTMTFVVPAGFIGPISPQHLSISSNASSLLFTATASTANNKSWLSVTHTTDATPANLDVNISQRLPPGTYQGQITLVAPNATNSPQTISISLVVTSTPKKTPPHLVLVLFIGAALSSAPADPSHGDGLKQLLSEVTTNAAFPGAVGRVFSHNQFNDAVGFVASNLGEQDALVIVGHSAGGDTARSFAEYISQASFIPNRQKVRIKELITIDPIDLTLGNLNQAFSPKSRPSGVDFLLGFYQRYGTPPLLPPGVIPCGVFDLTSICGYRIIPADLEYQYDVPHTEIDNDVRVHQNIMQTLTNIFH